MRWIRNNTNRIQASKEIHGISRKIFSSFHMGGSLIFFILLVPSSLVPRLESFIGKMNDILRGCNTDNSDVWRRSSTTNVHYVNFQTSLG